MKIFAIIIFLICSSVSALISQSLSPQSPSGTLREQSAWQDANDAVSGTVQALAVQGTTLYVGTANGVAVSNDYGITWKPLNKGLSNRDIRTLLVNGKDIYAGTGGTGAFGIYQSGVYYLGDNTPSSVASWRYIGPSNPTYLDVFTINFLNGALYAGTYLGGVQRTADTGKTWLPLNSGLDRGLPIVRSFDVMGSTWIIGIGQGAHYSLDSGKSWNTTNLNNFRVSQTSVVGSRMYAATQFGLYRSDDSGKSWQLKPLTDGWVYAVTTVPRERDTLVLAGSSRGLFASIDGGNTWKTLSKELHGGSYWCKFTQMIAPNQDKRDTLLFYAADEGLFRSSDYGTTWTHLPTGFLPGIRDLALNNREYFIATNEGVFFSQDYGTTWIPRSDGLSNLLLSTIAVLPSSAPCTSTPLLSASSSATASLLAATSNGQLFLSRNSGITWSTMNTFTSATASNPTVLSLLSSGSTWFAGTRGNGIILSTNAGVTWQHVTSAVFSTEEAATVYALATTTPSATNGKLSTVFAGTGNGLFRSTDNGATWTDVGVGLKYRTINAVAVSTTNASTLFVATTNGTYRSVDNGLTWKSMSALFSTMNVQTLSISDQALVIGIGGDIYRSMDEGATWTLLDNGLPVKSIINVLRTDIDGVFVVGTLTNGVFRLRPNNMIDATTVKADSTFRVPQNIPYIRYQNETGITPNDTMSIDVFRFVVNDGIRDSIPSILRAITIAVENASLLRRAAICSDSVVIGEIAVNSSPLRFAGMQGIVPDGGSRTFSLRVSFASPVSDHQQISCVVNTIGFDPTGSVLAARGMQPMASSVAGDDNRVIVQADRLTGINTPQNAIYIGQAFSCGVQAQDALGSRDVDIEMPVTLIESSQSPVITAQSGLTRTLARGYAEWSDVRFTAPGYFSLSAKTTAPSNFQAAPSHRIAVLNISGGLANNSTDMQASGKVNSELFGGSTITPNPFSDEAFITYTLPTQAMVTLEIFSLVGEKIITLVNEQQSAGNYSVKVSNQGLSNGVYSYRLQADSMHQGTSIKTKLFQFVR